MWNTSVPFPRRPENHVSEITHLNIDNLLEMSVDKELLPHKPHHSNTFFKQVKLQILTAI